MQVLIAILILNQRGSFRYVGGLRFFLFPVSKWLSLQIMLSETYRKHEDTISKKRQVVLLDRKLITNQLLYRGILKNKITIGFYINRCGKPTFFLPVLFLVSWIFFVFLLLSATWEQHGMIQIRNIYHFILLIIW